MAAQAKKQVTRLEDLLVEEVSMVDRPANKRRWLAVKSEDGTADKGTEIKTDDKGNLTATEQPAGDPPAAPAPVTDKPADPPATPAGDPPAEPEVENADSPEPVDKAVWTTAYVNDLPDASFLYIAPGGTKDEEGKTKPRTLRYFPVKDANGNPDPAHVRNALARIPQAKIPDAAKASAKAKAEKLLESTKKVKKDEPMTTPTNSPENKNPVELAKPFAQAGEVLDKLAKRLTIDPSVRTDLFRALQDACGRLYTVLNTADMAQSDSGNKGPSTLVPILVKELNEIAVVISDTADELASTVKKNDASADAGEDSIDLAMGRFFDRLNVEVEKRAIGKDRLGKLKDAIGVLSKILRDMEKPSIPRVPQPAGPDASTKKVKKDEDGAEDPQVVELRAQVEKMAGEMEKVTGVVKAQAKELATLRAARVPSNVIPVEGGDRVKKSEKDGGPVHWPLDMNAEKTSEKVDKSISFHDT